MQKEEKHFKLAQEINNGHKHFHYPKGITVAYLNKLELELLNVGLYTLNILIQNYQVILCRGLTIRIFLKLFHNTEKYRKLPN